jgi:hypothetical protein
VRPKAFKDVCAEQEIRAVHEVCHLMAFHAVFQTMAFQQAALDSPFDNLGPPAHSWNQDVLSSDYVTFLSIRDIL